jgi:tetratricopeptide (TPR) repeat protein
MDEGGQLERIGALIDLGRLEVAHTRLLALLAGDPTDAGALRLLALCYHRAGDAQSALAAADRAVAAEPEEEWGHRLRASALLVLDHPTEAVEAASEAVRLAPEGWAGHLLLGVALASAPGTRRAGHAALKRAASLAPAEAEIPFLQGRLHHALGATRSARRAYRDALRMDPQHAGALEGLAAIAMAAGRLGESLRYARSAAAAAPGAVATFEYLDHALIGVLGWAMLTAWSLLVALLFTFMPLARAVAGGIVLVYLVWLRKMAQALPANAAGFVWARVRHEPRLLVRLLAAATSPSPTTWSASPSRRVCSIRSSGCG